MTFLWMKTRMRRTFLWNENRIRTKVIFGEQNKKIRSEIIFRTKRTLTASRLWYKERHHCVYGELINADTSDTYCSRPNHSEHQGCRRTTDNCLCVLLTSCWSVSMKMNGCMHIHRSKHVNTINPSVRPSVHLIDPMLIDLLLLVPFSLIFWFLWCGKISWVSISFSIYVVHFSITLHPLDHCSH